MDNAEKPVPIFLVIGPEFTEDSEYETTRYRAEHFDRAITLITATELKDLAEEWASADNKRREEPFPLGTAGRQRAVLTQPTGQVDLTSLQKTRNLSVTVGDPGSNKLQNFYR